MDTSKLRELDAAVAHVVGLEWFGETVAGLEVQLAHTSDTFVWATVELSSIPMQLPGEIKSGWIFHLRRDVPSGAHFHPNSVQRMVMVAGQGDAEVAGMRMRMVPFNAVADVSDRWLVIEQGAAHEFFPRGEDMTVVSFHTCSPEELEEVECDSGDLRHYEGPDV